MGSLVGKGTGHPMEPKSLEGKLAAVLYAGAAGYSRLTGKGRKARITP